MRMSAGAHRKNSTVAAVPRVGGATPLLRVQRRRLQLKADPTRVITRLFLPAGEERVRAIFERVLALADDQVSSVLGRVIQDFSSRHKDITAAFRAHFEEAARRVNWSGTLSPDRCLLIGAYFTSEYSLESVALYNPSIVPHPDQNGLPNNACRFIVSLRACGEGHISSIEFRSGVIDGRNRITLDPLLGFTACEQRVPDKRYEKYPFFLKLIEMGAYNATAEGVLRDLGAYFTLEDLERAVAQHRQDSDDLEYLRESLDNILWLARSNYHLTFPEDSDISERVIFPVSENESCGIEDARFVRFVDENGNVEYFATYSAHNGFRVLPQFIETSDFRHFKIITLNGRYAQYKGMALFPRKIDGSYLMISRMDGENLYLMPSGNRHFWNESILLQQPKQPWEFVQIGNCGSPLETREGWLLLTHGVGPLRQYCMGAMLLDLRDPSKVIGQLEMPLLMPNAEDRDGHVPNVVYSCGALIHNDVLIIPYARSDTATAFATVPLVDLLTHLSG
ncbi:MAG: glycoside hydrolase family 130 protein [Phycisphaerae bacterium]